jgi:thiamine transport system substrate-binding protein
MIKRLATLLVVLAVVGTACGNEPEASDGESPTAARPKTTITLMTHDSFAVSEGLLEKFTDETGINVKVLPSGDAGAMVNQAILTKDKPVADVVFGVDNTFLTRALDAGIFEVYKPDGLEKVPDTLQEDTAGRVTPIDYGDVCVNADAAALEAKGLDVPTDLEQLAEPEYKDLLVVQNPATSSPGLAFLLATVARFGVNGWAEYWEKLRANGVEVTPGWEEAYNESFSAGPGKGPRPLVVSYASSPPAQVVFSEPKIDAPTVSVLDETCFRQIEYAGVLSGTKHPQEARRLIDFMLSPAFQEDVPLNMFVFPAVAGTKLPEVFEKFAATPENPLALRPVEIGENRDKWIEQWTDIVLR